MKIKTARKPSERAQQCITKLEAHLIGESWRLIELTCTPWLDIDSMNELRKVYARMDYLDSFARSIGVKK